MAWGMKDRLFQKLGATEDAIKSYERVLELDPNNSKAKENLLELQNNPGK
jgi:tetratricopeptide (TPR) repeat protein